MLVRRRLANAGRFCFLHNFWEYKTYRIVILKYYFNLNVIYENVLK